MNMKSIGIITIHNPQNNYGGALQSFALYEYLRRAGYNVEVIDLLRPNHYDYIKSARFQPMRNPISKADYIKGWLLEIMGYRRSFHWDSTRGLNATAMQRFSAFNNQVKLSDTYNYIPDLYRNPPKYDVYIAGSDQLWNPTQCYSLEPYFLTFVKNKNAIKMSYGTSIGITDLSSDEKTKFRKWLSTFDYISIREAQAKKLLEPLVSKPVERVPDPTFLLEQKLWQKMANEPDNKNYILIFSLGKRKILLDKAIEIANQWCCKVKIIDQTFPSDVEIPPIVEIVDDAGPLEFIGLIKDARLVLTDSFHCTVFSLISATRNFYSYLDISDNRRSRIEDLLEIFRLSDRLIHSMEEIPDNETLRSIVINHNKVTEIIKKEQSIGSSFLIKALDNEHF